MKIPIFTTLQNSLGKINQWFLDTPERALDEAYRAALMIKAIEDEHFGGQKITPESSNYNDSAMSCFYSDLNKYLTRAKLRLTEFKASRSIASDPEQKLIRSRVNNRESIEFTSEDIRDRSSILLEKLNFVDEIIKKYSIQEDTKSLIVIPKSELVKVEEESTKNNVVVPQAPIAKPNAKSSNEDSQDMLSDKTGILPRSILGTFTRIQRDLKPNAEQEVVSRFRYYKKRTVTSLKFILLLILVPLLTQQLSKNFLISPIVEKINENNRMTFTFINNDLQEEAFTELEKFQRQLQFQSLIGVVPKLSTEEVEEKLQDKAIEIAEEFHEKSIDAIKNIGADTCSLIAFCLVLVFSRKEISTLKFFIDDIVYGLSDSAKAFIIILFTDIFVGFHSPHGWEVLLERISRHLGLPENRDFIFLFIATFPVILDTMIKYWIFRYLNRISPSAVATYRNMNE